MLVFPALRSGSLDHRRADEEELHEDCSSAHESRPQRSGKWALNLLCRNKGDVRVDRAARFHPTFAVPFMLTNTLPPLRATSCFDSAYSNKTLIYLTFGAVVEAATRFFQACLHCRHCDLRAFLISAKFVQLTRKRLDSRVALWNSLSRGSISHVVYHAS